MADFHGDLTLPKVQEAYVRHLKARARLWDEGIVPEDGLPEATDRPLIPDRVGHGSSARRQQHIRDGERPCVACEAAEHAYRYPMGDSRPFGWTFRG